MTENTGDTERADISKSAQDMVGRAAGLSDEVLKSVEAGQRAAIDAVRRFLDTVDEAMPTRGDEPSRVETVVDAALDMADKLVTTQYDFLRSVVRNADQTLRKAAGDQSESQK